MHPIMIAEIARLHREALLEDAAVARRAARAAPRASRPAAWRRHAAHLAVAVARRLDRSQLDAAARWA